VLYEPYYLRDIVRYYAPHLRSAPLRDGLPPRRYARRVFVMGSFLDNKASAATVRDAVRKLERTRDLEQQFRRPQIKVWELK